MNIKKIIWDKALHYLNRFFPHIRKQIISFSYLSKYYGQYNSIKKNAAVDSKDNAIPWLTYPAIEYLGKNDVEKLRPYLKNIVLQGPEELTVAAFDLRTG